jgi:hypothetical protein
MVWTGLMWRRIGTSGGLLWTRWTFRFHTALGSFWVAALLAACQEGLSSIRLVSWLVKQHCWTVVANKEITWNQKWIFNSWNEKVFCIKFVKPIKENVLLCIVYLITWGFSEKWFSKPKMKLISWFRAFLIFLDFSAGSNYECRVSLWCIV